MITTLAIAIGWVALSIPAGILIGKVIKFSARLDQADRQLAEY